MKSFGRTILSVAAVALTGQGALAEGNAAEGKRVFRVCKQCHRLNEAAGKKEKEGPHLHGLLGRKAGSVAGFEYSTAMRESGLTWDAETLDRYLGAPQGLVPGTRMDFEGLADERDRLDLIAYLKVATKAGP